MDRARAEAILSQFVGKRVLVIGDLMVDEYIWGQVSRVSPEAPVLVIDAERESAVPGGAANAANQLLALGAEVIVSGAVGDDPAGVQLRATLQSLGANTHTIVASEDRPTTRKTRIVARTEQGAQQVARVDREKRTPLPASTAAELIARTTAALADCDALLFSDYLKGVLSHDTVSALIAAARERGHIAITANPKPQSAGYYRDVDIAQLNRREADEASRSHRFESADVNSFHTAGEKLRDALGVRNLLVTRSAEGLTLFQSDNTYFDVAPHRVDVFDGTGAGDSTVAGVTLALTTGATLSEAVAIGNAAGGAVVRKVGVVTATREEIAVLFGG